MNLKNLYDKPLTIYLYNYDSTGHQSYTENILAGQKKKLNYIYDKMLIFTNNSMFTPISKNKSLDFTINLSPDGLSQQIASIQSSDLTISTFINDLTNYYDKNCINPIGNQMQNICIDIQKIIDYITNFKMIIQNDSGYTYWYIAFNVDQNNKITEYSVNELNDNYNFIQFVMYDSISFYLSGLIQVEHYYELGGLINVNLIYAPNDEKSMYTLVASTSVYDIFLTTDITNYINNGSDTSIDFDTNLTIESNILGLKICVVVDASDAMNYNLVSIPDKNIVTIANFNLNDVNYTLNNSNQYIGFFNFNLSNLYIYGILSGYINIFQYFTMENGNSYYMLKIILVDKNPDITVPSISSYYGSTMESALMYSFDSDSSIALNQLKYIKSQHFTIVSDIDLTLYFNFFDENGENTTFTQEIKSMVPFPMFMFHNQLELLSYDTEQYRLYQFLENVSPGILITIDSSQSAIKSPVMADGSQNINLYQLNCDIENYLFPNCSGNTNYTQIGSPDNHICINNLSLFASLYKVNIEFYCSQPLYLYISNYGRQYIYSYYISLSQTTAGTYYNSISLPYTFQYMQIIYTLDNKTFGIFNICDTSQVKTTGCTINLNLTKSVTKKPIRLAAGSNNINYITNNLGSNVKTVETQNECTNSDSKLIGENLNLICVNMTNIYRMNQTNNTINTTTDYIPYIIVMLVVFFIIIIIFLLYVFIYRYKKYNKSVLTK